MPPACHGTGDGVFGEGRPGNEPEASGPEGGDKSDGGRGWRWPNKKVIAVGVATAAVAAAGISYAATQSSPQGSQSTAGGIGNSSVPAGPMHLTSMTPASKTTGVDGAEPITISFSAPVAPNSPSPTLSPSVPGSWSALGNSMVFTPSAPFTPSTRVTVSIPDGPTGVRSAGGALLSTPLPEHFTTGNYSQAGLAELLAQQGYLPMSWSPSANGAVRAANAESATDPATLTAAGEAYDPPAGQYTWDTGYPSMLKTMWSPDSANVILRGAVMAFESEHNMTVDASLTPQFWRALFRAQLRGERNTNGYTYAVASKHVPETLTIYHNGHIAMRTLANTGIPVSPTVDGTFPVYQKFRFQIMRGTNPDGSSYADPVSYVSYFNGGDAVHYFPRGSYGFQQSLGCVELPWNSAARAYPYLTYGSLVTVTG